MRIKKFQGRNMRESIEKMRQELGEEAVILSTREIDENGLTYTELVAGIEPADLAQHREQQNRVPMAISHAAGERRVGRSAAAVSLAPDVAPIAKAHFQNARSTASTKQSESSAIDELRLQVQTLTETVQALVESRQHRFSDILPPVYCQLYRELRSKHFSEEQAMLYITQLTRDGFSADVDTVRAECKRLIASGINTASPIRIGGERSVILVYGPPGSGKSSVSTKLSSSFALTVNATASILRSTTDSSASPSNMQGVRVLNYETTEHFNTLLGETSESDFVFVETTIDPRSPNAAQQLEDMRRTIRADCVLLTIPVGMHQSSMSTWLDMGRTIQNLSLVFTNMDSQTLNGDCLDMIRERNAAISFVTDGQQQPQFIKAASPEKIVQALFGEV